MFSGISGVTHIYKTTFPEMENSKMTPCAKHTLPFYFVISTMQCCIQCPIWHLAEESSMVRIKLLDVSRSWYYSNNSITVFISLDV
jgi:hypothetical protein